MSFETIKRNQLEYLRAAGLPTAHGFSTRYGGVSAGPLSSLNLGFSRGDEPDNVRENWRRFGEAVGFSTENLILTHQIHGDAVRVVNETNRGEGFTDRPAADGPRRLAGNRPWNCKKSRGNHAIRFRKRPGGYPGRHRPLH